MTGLDGRAGAGNSPSRDVAATVYGNTGIERYPYAAQENNNACGSMAGWRSTLGRACIGVLATRTAVLSGMDGSLDYEHY